MDYREFYRKLLSEMDAVGLMVDSLTPFKLMRCKANGDKGGARSGWYWFADDADRDAVLWLLSDLIDEAYALLTETSDKSTTETSSR